MKKTVIDAHIHMFPDDLPARWQAYADRDPWFAALTRKPENGKGTEEKWSTPEECLECADAAGVQHMVMQGWYWNDYGLMTAHNDYMAEVVRRYPARFSAFAALNPKFGDRALYEIERCQSLGFAGVGELGPGGNGYDFADPQLLEALRAAERLNLPVCIHCGEPVGHSYPGKDRTPLHPILQIVRELPDLTLILAHQGGGLPAYEIYPEVRALLGNVYYDLAANPLLYRIEGVRQLAALAGAERILFGSDFPLLLYPRTSRDRDMSRFVGQMTAESGLSEEELRLVLHDNAARLLGIENYR